MTEHLNGIINVNKPAEWTSHDCVAVLRRVLGMKRIGHTGTLDPMATGVLPLCIGSTTRIMEYLDLDFKTYDCQLKLGIITDTADIWGHVLEEHETAAIEESDIRKAFAAFSGGLIEQIPPKYAAIKVNGKKLYQYAREGQDVEIKPRQIYIKSLELGAVNLQEGLVQFQVVCSKGTYIRSICRDVGDALGCGGTMASLIRTASGQFIIEDSVDMETLKTMDKEQVMPLIRGTDFPLVHFGKAILDVERAQYFCNGGHIAMGELLDVQPPEYQDREPELSIRSEYRQAYNVYLRKEEGDVFLGVAFYNDQYQKLVADKVFNRG